MAGGANDDEYTYDLGLMDGGPRRPDVNDLGGAGMVDDDPAPKKGEEPFAGLFNEHTRNLAGINRVISALTLWIRFISGTPTIVGYAAMGTKIDVSPGVQFTLTHPATGHVVIAWVPGTLPPQENDPKVNMSGDGTGWGVINGANVNAVDVFTKSGGSAADVNFIVEIR